MLGEVRQYDSPIRKTKNPEKLVPLEVSDFAPKRAKSGIFTMRMKATRDKNKQCEICLQIPRENKRASLKYCEHSYCY
jgi:hypothetical protein